MNHKLIIALAVISITALCYGVVFTFLMRPTFHRFKAAVASCLVLLALYFVGMFGDPHNADSEIGTFGCRFFLFPGTVALLCVVILRGVRPWKKQCK